MKNSFFAYLSRIKFIDRWALMRNPRKESLSEHSYEVAVLAHALAVLGNRRLGKQYDASRAALLGLYHDAPESITGDMPTPVKYFSPKIREAYGEVEQVAGEKLLSMLPGGLRGVYKPLLLPGAADAELLKRVKAADKLSAYIKCAEELKAGNREFLKAEQSTKNLLRQSPLPEVEYFMEEFLPSYSLTLDEQE